MTRGGYWQSLVAGAVLMMAVSATAQAAKYKEVTVTDGGSITGKLTFEGALPADAVQQIAINKNPEVCDEGGTGYREVVWVDVEGGALRGAFVFIDKIKEGKAWADPTEGIYLINQKACRFRPWAQIVRRGPVTIRNSDMGVLHNINMRELIGVEKDKVVKRTMFNFGQPDPGDIVDKVKPRRSPYLSVNCEAHNFMFGFLLAPTHPYAAVVGEDGSFSIDGIPPGKYTVKAWHPNLGLQKTKLVVEAGAATEANFVFTDE